MKPSIYFFSGPCGSGKTALSQTFARRLAEKDSRGQVYLIHGDSFHKGFIENGKEPLLSWPEILRFSWGCICSTADRALASGLDVVIDYVVEEELRRRLVQRGEPDLIDRSLFLKKELERLPENQGHFFDNINRR